MRIVTIASFILLSFLSARAQDSTDLLKVLEVEDNSTSYTIATFKATRLINGSTVENLGKGVLDVRISHRFGRINGGAYELFGLDNATARLGLDYGISNRLMAGIGRSSFEKTIDGFIKWKVLRQSTGKIAMPFTVSYLVDVSRTTLKTQIPGAVYKGKYRMAYVHQLIIGRKFTNQTSFLVAPTYTHRNLVTKASDPNELFAIGFGGRQKLTKRLSLTAEYYYQFDNAKLDGTTNSLSVGFDIETGGHVFQLHFSNSQGINERSFITGTNGHWDKGDIHFGFNISRVFSVGKTKNTGY